MAASHSSRAARRLVTGWFAVVAYVFGLPGVSLAATTLAVELFGPHDVELTSRGDSVVFVLHHPNLDTHTNPNAHAATTAPDRHHERGHAGIRCVAQEDDHELVVSTPPDATLRRETSKARRTGEPRIGWVLPPVPLRPDAHVRVATLGAGERVHCRAGPMACVQTTVLRI
ncbi:MAG: hypothetical protein Q7S40_12080 [Opitutaceae bacterium]|nr:hypothetical protein [Opitutaceae bacterium]